MTTVLLSNDVNKAQARYKAITHQIAERKDLHVVLREIDEAISLADELTIKAILSESPHNGLDALKNELWYLKYQILERTE